MIVTAGFLISHRQFDVAMIPIGCFLITGLLGLTLWVRRDRLDPFWSLIAVMAALAVAIPVAWYGTSVGASPEALAR